MFLFAGINTISCSQKITISQQSSNSTQGISVYGWHTDAVSVSCNEDYVNSYNAEIFYRNHWDKQVFSIWIIINVLLSSFRFIWILLLWVYGYYNYFSALSAGIVFTCQNLTSTDRFCHIKTARYFSSFEAGIANAISSFKWRTILLFMKNRHV